MESEQGWAMNPVTLAPQRLRALAADYGTLTHDAIECGSGLEFIYQSALLAGYYGRLWLDWAEKQTRSES